MSLAEIHNAFLNEGGKGVWVNVKPTFDRLIKQYGDEVATRATVLTSVQHATVGWTPAMVEAECRRIKSEQSQRPPAVEHPGATAFGLEMAAHCKKKAKAFVDYFGKGGMPPELSDSLRREHDAICKKHGKGET